MQSRNQSHPAIMQLKKKGPVDADQQGAWFVRVSAPTLSRREWGAAAGVAVGGAALLLLPYLLGHWLAPAGSVYTGLLQNVEDGTYLSAIAQGRAGAWVYRDLFTLQPHTPAFIEGFYLFLGHLGRWLGLSVVEAWHLGRFLSNIAAFLATFLFVATFLPQRGARWTAYLLALSGSGWDVVRLPQAWEWARAAEAVPLDLKMPEAHLFFSGLMYPHFTAGIAFILLFFLLLLYAYNAPPGRHRWLLLLGAGASNLALAVIYPFLILLLAAVMGGYLLLLMAQTRRVLWREGLELAGTLLLAAPLYLYYFRVIQTSDVYRAWNAQAVTLSPHPLHYLLTYAPLLLPALAGWRTQRSLEAKERRKFTSLWVWLGAAVLLLYLPVPPQRRFVEGLHVPLAALAAYGLTTAVLPWLLQTRPLQALLRRPRYQRSGVRRLLLLLALCLNGTVSVYLYLGALATLTLIQPYPLFRPQEEIAAMTWLRDASGPGDRILSSYWTGSYLPVITGDAVFVGHLYETVDFATRKAEAEQFFAAPNSEAWRQQLLAEHEIDYVFYGPAERALGDFDPTSAAYLRPVWQNKTTAIYAPVGQR
ncbi:MAG: hypothetical protein Fur0021_17460 [Candidatus Promineifilaceae bacterium]